MLHLDKWKHVKGSGLKTEDFEVLKRKASGFLCLGLGLLSCF